MRLAPGISLNRADDVLRTAETTWSNARASQDLFRAYSDAVHETYPTLAQAFVPPDLGAGLRSTAYWNLLPIGGARAELGFFTDPAVAANVMRAHRAENQALSIEIDNQLKALERALASASRIGVRSRPSK